MDTCAWEPTLCMSVWSFLKTFIANGQGGWGLSCVTESEAASNVATEDGVAAAHAPVWRVYHWGSTAPHVYLLVYVASKSKIRLCPAVEWVDAGGDVVMVMPTMGEETTRSLAEE